MKFIMDNFKIIVATFAFIIGLYVQHEINNEKIAELQAECGALQVKQDKEYQKMDAMKVDKSVFEMTLKQLSSMSEDIREIRNDLKDALNKR